MYYKKNSPGFVRTLSEKSDTGILSFPEFILGNKMKFLFTFALMISLLLFADTLFEKSESELQIAMNDYVLPNLQGGVDEAGMAMILSKSITSVRIQQIVFSKEMFDHLIKTFNLYGHYKVPENSPYGESIVRNKIRSNMNYKFGNGDIISILFRDKDAVFAANVANEIGSKIQELNQTIMVNSLNKKARMNEMILNEMTSEYEKANTNLKQCLSELNEISQTNIARNDIRWTSSVDDFKSLSKEFSSKWDNFITSDKIFKMISQTSNQLFLPDIRIIQPAVPTKPGAEYPFWLKYIGFILVSIVLSISTFYLLFHLRSFIQKGYHS
ncbi:MAG TPA: hypothetical protein PKL85_04950 [Bacteroidia bacterium]|nr:hypothetical protein [Bacteroidia bacterium]